MKKAKQILMIIGIVTIICSQCLHAEVCDCPINDWCYGVWEIDHLVSFPIIIGYYGHPHDIEISGASELSRIEISVPMPNEYYSIEAYPDSNYIFEVTQEDNVIHCQVQSGGTVFGKEKIRINSRFMPPLYKFEEMNERTGSLVDCGGYAFVPVIASRLRAFNGNGEEVVLKARSGSIYYLQDEDYVEEFLVGKVLYRDEITPCAEARILVCAINGARYDTSTATNDDGNYIVWPGLCGRLEWPNPEGIEAATGCYSLTVRVCLSRCGECFEPEEIILNRKEGGGIELTYHDFILPLDPPSPTPTPTVTETPTPTLSPTPNPADINRDGAVDHEDVYLLQQNWLQGEKK